MLPVVSFRQSSGFCGPAALRMVLLFYGIDKSETALAKRCRSKRSIGTSARYIAAAARSFGLQAFVKDFADISDLEDWVEKRNTPVIVSWFSTDDGHYSVVVGVDKENIYLQDPELGHIRTMRLDTFKRVWFDFRGDFLKNKRSIVIRRMIVIYP